MFLGAPKITREHWQQVIFMLASFWFRYRLERLLSADVSYCLVNEKLDIVVRIAVKGYRERANPFRGQSPVLLGWRNEAVLQNNLCDFDAPVGRTGRFRARFPATSKKRKQFPARANKFPISPAQGICPASC